MRRHDQTVGEGERTDREGGELGLATDAVRRNDCVVGGVDGEGGGLGLAAGAVWRNDPGDGRERWM